MCWPDAWTSPWKWTGQKRQACRREAGNEGKQCSENKAYIWQAGGADPCAGGVLTERKEKARKITSGKDAVRVQDALHLSDAEVMEITHFERGNGLIGTNSNNIMVQFKASPLEKELITTDRRELKELVERMRQGDGTE